MPLQSVGWLKFIMPKVGDELMAVPTFHKLYAKRTEPIIPRHCVVIYTNPDHLWYTVRFDSGLTESYKMPELDVGPRGGYL